jgi:phosphoglycerate-specific signal transduction histidine kinase
MRATKAHFRSLADSLAQLVWPEQSTLVNGDDGRLAQVFVNLLISEFVVRLPWLPM